MKKTMNTIKKAAAIILVAIMLFGLLNVCAFAEDGDAKYKVTLHFAGIMDANGNYSEYTQSNTLSKGTGWSFTQKKLDNQIRTKKFSYMGVQYEYTGSWTDANGEPVTLPIKIMYADLTGDIDMYFYPVYSKTMVKTFKVNYIDNISTASGSWSNIDSFSSYTHTFKAPDSQPHYQFVTWKNVSTGATYAPGEQFTVTQSMINSAQSGSTSVIDIMAMWQPSVTVNYFVGGTMVNSVESFSSVSVYDFVPDDSENMRFIGWRDANGNTLDGSAAVSAPEITAEQVARSMVSVYAGYQTERSVSLSWDDADDQDGIRKSVEVQLFADGAPVGESVVLSEENGWTYTVGGLEAYAADRMINYSFVETDVPVGYTASYSVNGAETVITNTHAPAQTDVTVTNVWDDAEDEDGLRPETVAVRLYADGAAVGEDVVLGENGIWSFTWNSVPVYSAGKEINYSIERLFELNGYTTTCETDGNVTVITNRHEPYPIHKITVNYLNTYGSQIAESVCIELKYGREYDVSEYDMPEISGYAYLNTEGTVSGIVMEDVEINVRYAFIRTGETSEPETSEPETSEPETFEPETSESETSESETSEPETSEIETFEPERIDMSTVIAPEYVEETEEEETAEETNERIETVEENAAPAEDNNRIEAPAIVEENDEQSAGSENVKASVSTETETLTETEVPLANASTVSINSENAIPMAQNEKSGWALINLICVVLTCLVSLGMAATLFRKNDSEENDDNDDEDEKKTEGRGKILGVIPAIAAAVIFILTENVKNPMVMVDRWTIAMAAILLADLAVAIITRKRESDKEENQNA